MARSRIEVFAVPPTPPGEKPPKAYRMDPQPLAAVDGKWTSDEAKRNAGRDLKALGFEVRSVNVSPEKKLIAYVNEQPKPEREPRSSRAKPRIPQ